MRVLFTGSSSFTGYWFVRELVESGHQVIATFRGNGNYENVRAERTRRVRELCDVRFDCAFGSDNFFDFVGNVNDGFDVLCHHGAHVGDYRSADFNPYQAAALNLYRLPEVLKAVKARGCGRLVLTGSVFEQNEGTGSHPLRAFSPYGLSKGLTAAAAAFFAEREGMTFEKFVIPNPFGPLEELRFTSYLIRTWQKGETACVRTPRYVRDNVPVSLLARVYCAFVSFIPPAGAVRRINPSFYVETQGAFAQRVRAETMARLGLNCALEFAEQTTFPEPAVRINTEPIEPNGMHWNEGHFWNEFVEYYDQLTAG